MRNALLSAIALLFTLNVCATTTIGYTDGTHSRSNGVRHGSSTTQGMAIRLTAEKAQLIAGEKIATVYAAFCSSRFTSATLFITDDLDGEYLYSQSVTTSSTWKEYALDTPYEITGDELYVGFVGEISSSYSPLSFDGSTGCPATTYVHGDDGWEDFYSYGYGCANIQLILEAGKAFTDASLRAPDASGYYIAGQNYELQGYQLFNFGSETISSLDISYSLNSTEETLSLTDLSIQSGSLYDISLPVSVENTGDYNLSVSITAVNGSQDDETTDNDDEQTIFFYPSDIVRNYLIENFTGQTCTYCPAGHTLLQNAIDGREDVIVVSHHAGYAADAFTMTEDYALTYLYNSTSTFAPGFMVNRYRIDEQSSSLAGPVFNASSTTEFTARLSILEEEVQPYVSVTINSTYDENTRVLSGDVEVYCYTTSEDETAYLNLYIIQDSIAAYQLSGGDEYNHRHVFRGTIDTGNFGTEITLAQDSTISYPFSYTLPESITSTYVSGSEETFETDVNQMSLVAFVANYNADDPCDCIVYNAAATAFNDATTSAIKEIKDEGRNDYKDGDGSNSYTVYDLQGKAYGTLSGDLTTLTPKLKKGIYILKKDSSTKKVIVR